jgi:hypothetical protein
MPAVQLVVVSNATQKGRGIVQRCRQDPELRPNGSMTPHDDKDFFERVAEMQMVRL